MTLCNHPGIGIGRKYSNENRAGPWRYTESTAVAAAEAISVKLEDGAFLMLVDADLCFDVSYAVMQIGTTINFVGGTTETERLCMDQCPSARSRETTKQFESQEWVVHSDGTIGCKHQPSLVLGMTMVIVVV